MIQYIYERYGRDRAAICATVIHYRPRMAIREVGKALGLTEDITAALAKTSGAWATGLPDDHIRQAGLDPDQSGDPPGLDACRRAASASRATCRSTSAASC